jgi:hypothetical protein
VIVLAGARVRIGGRRIGEATQAMKAPDLAEAAKAFSVYLECH